MNNCSGPQQWIHQPQAPPYVTGRAPYASHTHQHQQQHQQQPSAMQQQFQWNSYQPTTLPTGALSQQQQQHQQQQQQQPPLSQQQPHPQQQAYPSQPYYVYPVYGSSYPQAPPQQQQQFSQTQPYTEAAGTLDPSAASSLKTSHYYSQLTPQWTGLVQPQNLQDPSMADMVPAIALARDESTAASLALQPSPTISTNRPSNSNCLTSLTSVGVNPPSPLMATSPSRPLSTSFMAHSPLSVASSVSPYMGGPGPLIQNFDEGAALDLFAALDNLGTGRAHTGLGIDTTGQRRLSVPDASAAAAYMRALSPALINGPGIGTSPMLHSDDDFDNLPYPTPGLEGLFDDLALIAGNLRDDEKSGTSIFPSAAPSENGSRGGGNQPIPNLVISSPESTDQKTKRSKRLSSPASSVESSYSDNMFGSSNGGTENNIPSGMFSCACGKSFKKLSSLRSHAKLHGRERSFICDQCNKGFLRKHDLTRHTTTHLPHGSKPYTCPCGVSFTRQDAMMRHIRAGRCDKPTNRRGRKPMFQTTPHHHDFTQYLPAPSHGQVKMVPYPMPPAASDNQRPEYHGVY